LPTMTKANDKKTEIRKNSPKKKKGDTQNSYDSQH
jgi:hypothetical protein